MDEEKELKNHLEAYGQVVFSHDEETDFTGDVIAEVRTRRKKRAVRFTVLSAMGAVVLTLLVWNGSVLMPGFFDRMAGNNPLIADSVNLTQQIENHSLDVQQLAIALLDEQTSDLYILLEDQADIEPVEILAGFDDDRLNEALERIQQVSVL